MSPEQADLRKSGWVGGTFECGSKGCKIKQQQETKLGWQGLCHIQTDSPLTVALGH